MTTPNVRYSAVRPLQRPGDLADFTNSRAVYTISRISMALRAPITILIPAKNEEVNLPFALASVADWAQDVFVLDSGSTDRTREITEQYGAKFVYHAWEGYARQKNWGLDNLPITTPWVFILDADESITPTLRDELIRIATADDCREDGFYINRYLVFLDKRIGHCGYYPSWNIRFFRQGKARYEERSVHEHMIVSGAVGYLRGEMEHHDRRGLDHFIAKHNHYSTLEARELFRIQRDLATGTISFGFWRSPIERRRWIKHKIWPRIPARWLARWISMYIFQFGFLDGSAGFHLCLLLAEYEHQISLKLQQLWKQHRRALKAGQSSEPAVAAVVLPEPPAPVPSRILVSHSPGGNGKAAMAKTGGQSNSASVGRDEPVSVSAEAWPYPFHIYILRVVWWMVWCTVWKFLWHRWPRLRTLMLRLFGAKTSYCAIYGSAWIEMPWDLEIGHGVLVGPRVHLYNLGGLSIGDNTIISQDAYICGGTHDHTDPTYPLIRKKITIGRDVWIAAGAFIYPGVTIGDGAVIGARSVVVKDVEPWTIVAGHPAKVIKKRLLSKPGVPPAATPELEIPAETASPAAPESNEGPADALAAIPSSPSTSG